MNMPTGQLMFFGRHKVDNIGNPILLDYLLTAYTPFFALP